MQIDLILQIKNNNNLIYFQNLEAFHYDRKLIKSNKGNHQLDKIGGKLDQNIAYMLIIFKHELWTLSLY